jgi:hypothetical protein
MQPGKLGSSIASPPCIDKCPLHTIQIHAKDDPENPVRDLWEQKGHVANDDTRGDLNLKVQILPQTSGNETLPIIVPFRRASWSLLSTVLSCSAYCSLARLVGCAPEVMLSKARTR